MGSIQVTLFDNLVKDIIQYMMKFHRFFFYINQYHKSDAYLKKKCKLKTPKAIKNLI